MGRPVWQRVWQSQFGEDCRVIAIIVFGAAVLFLLLLVFQ